MSGTLKTEQEIFKRYFEAYGGDLQGCCLLIADEIQCEIGGDVVAGEITWYGGSCRRTHWWVDLNGKIIDPMGDYILSFEEWPGRNEIHRDKRIFDRLLPNYEKWRV